jgi:hypothetical protein
MGVARPGFVAVPSTQRENRPLRIAVMSSAVAPLFPAVLSAVGGAMRNDTWSCRRAGTLGSEPTRTGPLVPWRLNTRSGGRVLAVPPVAFTLTCPTLTRNFVNRTVHPSTKPASMPTAGPMPAVLSMYSSPQMETFTVPVLVAASPPQPASSAPNAMYFFMVMSLRRRW